MDEDRCPERVQVSKRRPKTDNHNKDVNRLGRVSPASSAAKLTLVLLLLPLLFLTASSAGADGLVTAQKLVHGIVTTRGVPVADATVEIRDLHGIKVGTSHSDVVGDFEIKLVAEPGDYILLAAKELRVIDQRITVDGVDVEVSLALPAVTNNVAPQPVGYAVSATALRIPGKAWDHLRSAQREFQKGSLVAASVEVNRALQIDRQFAQAYSMRALVKLAMKNQRGAVEDAERAALLDPLDAAAYLTLGTAYNTLHEFEKAEQAQQRALSLRPDAWQAQLEWAKSLCGQGRFVLALRELELLDKDFPDVHLVRGNVLMRLGRRQEASGEFALFLRQAPNDSRRAQIQQIIAAVRHGADHTPFVQP
jgi:tetratricopeptide (TPR) repeat protein